MVVWVVERRWGGSNERGWRVPDSFGKGILHRRQGFLSTLWSGGGSVVNFDGENDLHAREDEK